MAKKHGNYKMWTKAELAAVIELWETMTAEEMCAKLKVNQQQLYYVARLFRKQGYKLPRKYNKGTISGLIKDVLTEKGLSR